MVNSRSSQKASIASWILRFTLRSGERNTSFATCCEIVLPPATTRPSTAFCQAARITPKASIPPWVKKRRSSMASTASGSTGAISPAGISSPHISPAVATSEPSAASTVIASGVSGPVRCSVSGRSCP